MIIKSLKLTNFRSHTNYQLICRDETSLILGPNGSGKTSVLEAIYVLTRGKSFRAADKDIIKHHTDFYRAEIEYLNGENIVAAYDGHQKNFLVSGQKFRRLPKKYQYPVVLFEPSDLNLITHAPSRRRTYFDRLFGQFDPRYATSLSRYEKALKQRNELLKNEELNPDASFSWNTLLARYGSDLYTFRQQFTDEINQHFTSVYQSIAKNDDEVKIVYSTEVKPSEYLHILEQNFQKDHYLGHTTYGVHRDDYLFKFNQSPAETSASRGESRTMILALKFIEADLLKSKTSHEPLILLDDVFSELDDTRRESLIKNFKNHQIIITSVESVPTLEK